MKKSIKILDKGFVTLIDRMGNDQRVLDSARVSTGSISKGVERDRGLIRYLMMNKHETPFEKIIFEFHVRIPLYIGEQVLRHRISSFNKESGRYKELKTDFYVPKIFRGQDDKNKQSSKGMVSAHIEAHNTYLDAIVQSEKAYKKLIEFGVVRELSRGVLPTSTFTEFYWTINFRSLMNFLKLRLDEHAQWEIQELARGLKEIIDSLDDIKWTVEIFEEMMELENLFQKCIGKDKDLTKLKSYLETFVA